MQLYAIFLGPGNDPGSELVAVISPEFFRPRKFFTNVEAPELGYIDGIFYPNDPENQLLGTLDLWSFSFKWLTAAIAAFMREHGLTGKTEDEIQDYLDDNGLSMPDVPRLELPSLKRGDRVRVTGRFPPGVALQWIGYVPWGIDGKPDRDAS